MLDLLITPFLQKALWVGLLVAAYSSLMGSFVVTRRMSFLGEGLAHAAFAGVALGLLVQAWPLWVAMPFVVVIALAMTWLRQRSNLSDDTVVGIFFSVSVAVGIVLMSMRQGFAPDALGYMFGSILAIGPHDAWTVVLVGLLVLASFPLWKHWTYATFDRDLAIADRHRVALHDYIFSALVALVVVASVKIVGTLLVTAFMVIPAATARLLSTTFGRMMWVSVGLGVGSVVPGLVASVWWDIPAGSAIVLTQALMFVLAMLFRGKA